MCQVRSTFVLFLVVAAVHNGDALRCWKCYSDYDITCRDYFNVTRIEENRRHFDNFNYGGNYGGSNFGNSRQVQTVRNDPHLEQCDETYNNAYNQKNVCLKRVTKGANGNYIVQRECRLVSRNLKAGECPEELTSDRSRNVDYCGTCEYDGCNTATSVTTNAILASILPLSIILLLKKW